MSISVSCAAFALGDYCVHLVENIMPIISASHGVEYYSLAKVSCYRSKVLTVEIPVA